MLLEYKAFGLSLELRVEIKFLESLFYQPFISCEALGFLVMSLTEMIMKIQFKVWILGIICFSES